MLAFSMSTLLSWPAFALVSLLQSAPVAAVPERAPRRVLIYTVSAGFEHDVVKRSEPNTLSLVERALVEMGNSSGAFEAHVSRDAASFDALAKFEAVFFYTTGELPLDVDQRRALVEYVKNGGGFVGVHCATDTLYTFPEYGEMLGATFDGHPWHEKVHVVVEDRSRASTAHLGAGFDIVDEIYQFKAPYERSNVHVLLSLDRALVDPKRPGVKRTDSDFALAWTKPFGRGRVFYTALGHQPEVWSDERFRAHVLGGIRFALHDEPRVALPEADEVRRTLALSSETPGDPRQGYDVFRRESGPMCIRCHRVNTVGGDVGPDLSSVARRLTREELVDAVLAPSASIDFGYESMALELSDGAAAFGRVVSEVDGRITLAETTGQLRVIATKDIAARHASKVSVMPDGLAGTLTSTEFRDLLAYVRTLKAPPAK